MISCNPKLVRMPSDCTGHIRPHQKFRRSISKFLSGNRSHASVFSISSCTFDLDLLPELDLFPPQRQFEDTPTIRRRPDQPQSTCLTKSSGRSSTVCHSPLRKLKIYLCPALSLTFNLTTEQFCAFKLKTTKGNNFCRNEYNVSGFCNRQSCPLANSRYATVRTSPKGTIYLYIKTVRLPICP